VPSNTEGKQADQELVDLQRALLSGPTTGVPATADPEARKAYLGRRAEQREAYGQFEATSEIYDPDGSALIFNPGAAVPVEHVERFGLEETGMVRRVASPELARRGMRSDRQDPEAAEPRTITDSLNESAPAIDSSADKSGRTRRTDK
jgi:hypothetical protein